MWGGVLVGASFLLFIFFNFMSNMTAFWWIMQQNICLVLTLETFQWDSEGSHIVMLPMSTHNKCLLCVSLPLVAIGWSVVCDCGIFWAYFLSQDSNMVTTVSTLKLVQLIFPTKLIVKFEQAPLPIWQGYVTLEWQLVKTLIRPDLHEQFDLGWHYISWTFRINMVTPVLFQTPVEVFF